MPVGLGIAAAVVLCLTAAARGGIPSVIFVVPPCGNDSNSGVTTTCLVPFGPKATIGAAIIAAADGDQVVVLGGVYNESINFLGKAITVRSAFGPEATIIDGTGFFHVVQCVMGEGPLTVLDGFTITGGNASSGGGMLNTGSSPTVINCIFSGNDAANFGGGRPRVSLRHRSIFWDYRGLVQSG